MRKFKLVFLGEQSGKFEATDLIEDGDLIINSFLSGSNGCSGKDELNNKVHV